MKRALWAVVALLALIAAWQGLRAGKASRAAWAADTARVNEAARSDVTRRRLVQDAEGVRLENARLVELGRIEASAAARAGRELANARGRILVLGDSVASLLRRGTATVTRDAEGVTVAATDSVDTLGVRARASVEVPLDTALRAGPVRWTWTLERQPITLDLELTCRGTAAVARVTGPTWAPLELSDLRQDPRTCAPPTRAWEPFRLELPSLPVAAGLLAAGLLLGVAAAR